MNELQTLMQEAAKQNPEALRDMLRRLSTEESNHLNEREREYAKWTIRKSHERYKRVIRKEKKLS